MTVGYAAPLHAVERLEVTETGEGLSLVASVYIDPESAILQGHFPGLPLYPGVFVVESLGQAVTGALARYGRAPQLRTVHSLRLTAALHGGDELTLAVDVVPRGGGWHADAVGRRRDRAIAATVRATFDEGGEP